MVLSLRKFREFTSIIRLKKFWGSQSWVQLILCLFPPPQMYSIHTAPVLTKHKYRHLVEQDYKNTEPLNASLTWEAAGQEVLQGLKPSFSTKFNTVNTIKDKADALQNKLGIPQDFMSSLFSKSLQKIVWRLNRTHCALHNTAQEHRDMDRYAHGKSHGIINTDIKTKR